MASVKIWLSQTGIPWRNDTGIVGFMMGLSREEALRQAYEREPLKPPFEPFQVSCVLLGEEGPFGVMLEKPVMLSNGCGPTHPLRYYQLNLDGTVSFFPAETTRYWMTRTSREKGQFLFRVEKQTEPTETWTWNVPTWEFDFRDEIREIVLLLLCAKKFRPESILSILPKDLVKMVGLLLFQTRQDRIWLRPKKKPSLKKQRK